MSDELQRDDSGTIAAVLEAAFDPPNGEPEPEPVPTETGGVGYVAAPEVAPSTPRASGGMMSVEELSEYDSETVRLVSAKESEVCGVEAQWRAAKTEAKNLKSEVEDAKSSLRSLIQDRDRQRGRKPNPTLFDGATGTPSTAPAHADEPEIDPDADLWKEYPVTFGRWRNFGLTAKDVERLNGGETKARGTCPIAKLGDVTKFITPNEANPSFARTLKDFKGFGDAAMDRWQKAEELFWQWWNQGGMAEFRVEYNE